MIERFINFNPDYEIKLKKEVPRTNSTNSIIGKYVVKAFQKELFNKLENEVYSKGFNDFYKDNGYKSDYFLLGIFGPHGTYYTDNSLIGIHSSRVSKKLIKDNKIPFTINFKTDIKRRKIENFGELGDILDNFKELSKITDDLANIVKEY